MNDQSVAFQKSLYSRLLTVRLTPQQRSVLQAEAARLGANEVDVIRLALEHYFASLSADKSASGSAGSNARPDESTAKVNATSIRSPMKSTRRKHSSH